MTDIRREESENFLYRTRRLSGERRPINNR